MASIRACDIAWAAGLFEGEGCIGRYTQSNSWRLTLGSKDLDVVETFAAIMGGGSIRPGAGGMHYWNAARWDDVKPMLERLLPYLHSRRREKALAMLANPPKYSKRPANATHCRHGHSLADAYHHRGERQCRECRRIRDRARYWRKKEQANGGTSREGCAQRGR